jgi:hypothetical protein
MDNISTLFMKQNLIEFVSKCHTGSLLEPKIDQKEMVKCHK